MMVLATNKSRDIGILAHVENNKHIAVNSPALVADEKMPEFLDGLVVICGVWHTTGAWDTPEVVWQCKKEISSTYKVSLIHMISVV